MRMQFNFGVLQELPCRLGCGAKHVISLINRKTKRHQCRHLFDKSASGIDSSLTEVVI